MKVPGPSCWTARELLYSCNNTLNRRGTVFKKCVLLTSPILYIFCVPTLCPTLFKVLRIHQQTKTKISAFVELLTVWEGTDNEAQVNYPSYML